VCTRHHAGSDRGSDRGEAVGTLIVEQTTELPVEPVSAGRARRFVTAALQEWSLPGILDETTLLTSEVVTNALLHSASSSIRLRLVLLVDAVRVEVDDESVLQPRPRHYSPESGTGRGLALVEAAARCWGATPTAHGKTVWFEIATA
jgi:anti-sigma regulatory factor (Ser/Thr protein kinase)